MKKYPFSIQKHAHDVEFRRNRVFCIMHSMEHDEIPMDVDLYDSLTIEYDDLTDLQLALLDSRDGRIAYLTGPQIGLAKKCAMWASDERASSLTAVGKLDYLQYC